MSKATDRDALSPHPIAPIVCQVLAWGPRQRKQNSCFYKYLIVSTQWMEQAKSGCRGHWHSWDLLLSMTHILKCSLCAFVKVTGHRDKPALQSHDSAVAGLEPAGSMVSLCGLTTCVVGPCTVHSSVLFLDLEYFLTSSCSLPIIPLSPQLWSSTPFISLPKPASHTSDICRSLSLSHKVVFFTGPFTR